MLKKLESLNTLIGNTPLRKLDHKSINLFAKLEYHNMMNSIKARTAFYILKSAIERGEVTNKTTIIESSSGNFAVAMATLCRHIGIKFIPIIDNNINKIYEELLYSISYKVIKVTERDSTGGYLLNRLKKVREMLHNSDVYWSNQYNNQDNFYAHYYGIGKELAQEFDSLDYAFIGVGTGGTISGVSTKLKEKFPNIKIIAVDTKGSIIFGGSPHKRYIPGIGSSIVPDLVKKAIIDEVIIVPEVETIEGCHELFGKHAIFAGGSSGTSYIAVNNYFRKRNLEDIPNVVFLCPDGGLPYVSTVYNTEWVNWLKQQSEIPILI